MLKPTPGFLYEPRAFWSVARIESGQGSARPPNTLRLPRADFLNGERFPVTLTKVCVAPINFVFDVYSDLAALAVSNFRNDGVASLEFAKLSLAAPQRQYYTPRPGPVLGLTAEPSYTPVAAGANGSPSFASSLWGISRWRFDHAMVIPKLGDLEFDLSTFNVDGAGLMPSVGQRPRPVVQFEEVGQGLFGGQSRPQRLEDLGGYFVAGTTQTPLYGPDGFGPPTQGSTTQVWPPGQRYSARRYGAENASSDGSIPVTGFAVMIDQIGYDAFVVASHGPPPNPGSTVTPLASRIGTRARMRNGGTGAYWWRQGAPLSLVCPTITPANVYTLPRPITLGPGDSLDLELSVPPPVVINQNPIPSVYQIGVSFCGFAAIEA